MVTNWYKFSQNNSGGKYIGMRYVYVEANSPDEANNRAENIAGIYFDGVASGHDCPCCGNRWSRVHESSATFTIDEAIEDSPSISNTLFVTMLNEIRQF